MKRVLVIAAHPDDEVLGVGGTIAKYSEQGYEIYIHIVTEGASTQYPNDNKRLNAKRQAAVRANQILGGEEVHFGELPDMKLDTIPHVELNKELERIIKAVKPEVIFTHHSGDVNKDHKLICESTLVACRPVKGNLVKEIYAYETPSSTEWSDTKPKDYFIPNLYVRLTEKQLKNKCLAMKEYKTELRDYPHPRSIKSIKNYSKSRGNEAGYNYAEAFRLIRKWVD